MPRSVGVTVSAVLAIIGSAFTILFGAIMSLGSAFVSKSGATASVPVNIGAFLLVEAAIICGFGAWGLAAGIGLIYLRRWARISIIVFAVILVVLSLPGALFIAFIPLPKTNDPNLPVNLMPLMRIGMALFYAAFAALGGFWLYFFNKRTVKAQFQAVQLVPESAAGDSFLGVTVPAIPAPVTTQPARPLSIAIIGWFLLIASAIAPLGLLMNRALLPDVQLPFYFLGFFLFGGSAYLVFIVWMAAQMAAAVGLLKLKKWGWFAVLVLQCLGALNGALLMGIPDHRAKLQQLMQAMLASMNARLAQPTPFDFPIWVGFAMSLPIVFVILYFLITRRQVFASSTQKLVRRLP
jgi:hypothetical protein